MYLIIDCNNFYVSCEKVFNPALEGRPVVVAGSNGGCIIARSNEAKALGLKMSQPLFLCKDIIIKHSVVTLGTNFSLYHNMSRRVMQVIESFGLKTEVYSVDEAFVQSKSSTLYVAKQIRQTILQHTGISVSIGIAPTKTLAKLANVCAKKKDSGIHTLDPEEDLKAFDVQDVWGIGAKTSENLNKLGVFKVASLMKQNKTWVKKHFGLPLLKSYLELHGLSCIDLALHKPLQSMIHSRNFTNELLNIEAALKELKTFCRELSNRLRRQNLKTQKIHLKISSSRFKLGTPMKEHTFILLKEPTNYTPELHNACQEALTSIYCNKCQIKKMQITFCDLISGDDFSQKSLLEPTSAKNESKQQKLMQIMDNTQNRYSKNSLFLASEAPTTIRKAKSYTTSLEEILRIDIDAPIGYNKNR
jgi:DNA polymerase V